MTEPAYWRVSTMMKRNIVLAIQARQWGTPKGIGISEIKSGDRVVLYVSTSNPNAGYWGTAKVTSDPFVSYVPVWSDDVYPFRFKLTPEGPLRSVPVASQAVITRLGVRRLTHFRQAGIIRLTPREYRAIADLLATAL